MLLGLDQSYSSIAPVMADEVSEARVRTPGAETAAAVEVGHLFRSFPELRIAETCGNGDRPLLSK